MIKKVAVIGASGYLARRCVEKLSGEGFEVTGFSSSVSKNEANEKLLPINMLTQKINKFHCIVFFSYSPDKEQKLNIESLITELSELQCRIIFISTSSLTSRFISKYSFHKRKIERVLLQCDGHRILRPGIVVGTGSVGVAQIIRKFSRAKFLIIPKITKSIPVTRVKTLLNSIKMAVEDEKCEISSVVDGYVDYRELFRFFGYQGHFFSGPNIFPLRLWQTAANLGLLPNAVESLVTTLYLPERQDFQKDYFGTSLFSRNAALEHKKFFKDDPLHRVMKVMFGLARRDSYYNYYQLSRRERNALHFKVHELVELQING